MKLLKTIETNTDPAIIVTNNYPDSVDGCVLVGFYFFGGEDDGPAPALKIDDEKTVLLGQDEIREAIRALSEFLEE